MNSQANCLLSRAASDLARGLGPAPLRVGPSTIPSGGDGVYVGAEAGRVAKDAVVALYAGVYVPMVPLSWRLYAAAREEPVVDVLKLCSLWGGGALDERLKDVSFEAVEAYWLVLEHSGGLICGYKAPLRVGRGGAGPFAVGQIMNHPPAGTQPNVRWQEFLWEPEVEDIAANCVHSGIWYVDPETSQTVNVHDDASGAARGRVPGVAMVATRELEAGEELFHDYRISRPHPPWYTPVTKT